MIPTNKQWNLNIRILLFLEDVMVTQIQGGFLCNLFFEIPLWAATERVELHAQCSMLNKYKLVMIILNTLDVKILPKEGKFITQ